MPNGEWDVFDWQIGLGMPIEWFDIDEIIALLDATSSVEIDQFVLNWDGEPANIFEVGQTLLRSKGFFQGISAQGKITFARLRMANVLDLAGGRTVSPIPFQLEWLPSEGEGIDAIRGIVGELPWLDGKQFATNVLGDTELLNPPNSLRAGLFSEERSLTLDLPVLYRPEDETLANLISLAVFRAFGAPLIRIRVDDAGFGHGEIIELASPDLAEPWFVSTDGDLIDADGTAKWFGQIVGVGRNLGDSTVDLALFMHNWHLDDFPRLRAPSAVVTGRIVDLYLTIQNAFTVAPNSDGESFSIGDELELWAPDGTRRSGTSGAPDVRDVTGVAANSVTVSSAFTTPSVVGDILRLAHLDDVNGYPEGGNPTGLTPGFLTYTYLADTVEEVSPNDLPGHIYGFGQI